MLTQMPFELPFELLLYLQVELDANLLDQNVNELEFELFRMKMKPTLVPVFCFAKLI